MNSASATEGASRLRNLPNRRAGLKRGTAGRCAAAFGIGAAGAALLAIAGIALAQSPAPAGTVAQFHPGTESVATYPLPDSHGGTLTVRAGMPAQSTSFGPPPPFEALDTNRDGQLSEAETAAYPPLENDFLYASGGAKSISKARYEKWVAGVAAPEAASP